MRVFGSFAARSLTIILTLALPSALFAPGVAKAAQVCGCKKNSNGKVKRLVSPGPPTCSGSYTAICWDETSPRSYVEVFIPTDANQGPLPYNTATRVDFSNESQDSLGEWNTSTKEFVAQKDGTFLVQASVLFADNLLAGRTYFLYIQSDNDSPIATTKATFYNQASASGGIPDGQVSAQASVVLKLDAGEKIWVSVDHNSPVTLPSLYWRNYNTYLYITQLD